MVRFAKSWFQDLTIVTVFLTLLYGTFLGTRPLTPPDEGRYSEIPREMLSTHDYITPHLDGVKYLEKPPLFYWLQTIPLHFWGVHEWSLRLINALMGLLGCCVAYVGARKLYGRRCGLLTALMLGTSFLYGILSSFITLDITVSVFLMVCLFSFLLGIRESPQTSQRRFYFTLMYISAALATMTKGLIGIIFPSMIIGSWLIIFNQWRQLKQAYFLLGLLLFSAITVPWHVLVQLKNPEFFHFYFIEQHFLRYWTDYANRHQSLLFLPSVLTIGLLPWLGLLLIPTLQQTIKEIRQKTRDYQTTVFFCLWASLIFLFYMFSHSQLPPYVLPLCPPLILMTARYMDGIWDQQKKDQRLVLPGLLFNAVIILILSILLIKSIHTQFFTMSLSSGLIVTTSLLLLIIGPWLAIIAYTLSSIKECVAILLLSSSLFILSLNISYPLLDHRSTKPLAMTLKSLLKPSDTVANYNYYYQDLPVYLNRYITVVNGGESELSFGARHEHSHPFYWDENTFWRRWNSAERMFMIVTQHEYNRLKTKTPNMTILASTFRYYLVTNQVTFQLQDETPTRYVIPAKAGIYTPKFMDSRLRGNDNAQLLSNQDKDL